MQTVCWTVLPSLAWPEGGQHSVNISQAVVSGVQQAAAARHGVAGDTPSYGEHLSRYLDILTSIVPSTYLSWPAARGQYLNI